MNYSVLPNLIALTVLVAVFRAISRRTSADTLFLWLSGWVLVLLHFLAEFLHPRTGLGARIADCLSVDALVLAAVAFLVSVIAPESSRFQQSMIAVCAALPAIVYVTLLSAGLHNVVVYYALIASGAVAASAYCYKAFAEDPLQRAGIFFAGACAIAIAVWGVRAGDAEIGVEVILAALYYAVAFCYLRHYNRISAGVVTTVSGFLMWGSVFPAGVLLDRFAPAANISTEVWNIPKYLVAVGMILTLLEDQIKTSDYFGYHDELTCVPNRRLLEDRLEQALAYAHRSKTNVAVLQLDLDHFKEVNDTYGHPVGDKVLREVVARLSACVRPGDTLARSGGDEFTVVCDVEDLKAAESLAASMELALAAPIEIDGNEIQTGLSIGIALYPDDGADPDQLHTAADRAMYAAKRATRTPVHLDIGRPVSA